ncbi:hypothetical protein G7Y79_00024g055650 [Physcia stellaris]|nr:hypothetical protein G7Y79_00024g055650 [Physcia stellaris]
MTLQLWSQLGLKAALTFPTNCTISSRKQPDLLLKLSHLAFQQGFIQSSKAGGDSFVTRDTIPPRGVLVAHLEEVAITWRFSLPPASALAKKRKVDRSSSSLADETFYDIAGDRNDMILLDDLSYHRCPHQKVPRYQASEPAATDIPEFGDNFMLDTDHSSQESIVSSTFSQGLNSNGSTSSSCMLLPEDSTVPKGTIPDYKVVVDDWAKLVDLSFRSLIYSDKMASKGTSRDRRSIEPKLAGISPPLFSPGYLPAIAHRNAHISSVAQSITAVYNRSKSPAFRLEIEQMTSLSLEERLHMLRDGSGTEADNQPSLVMTSAIKLRLWQVCQRILFDSAAAKRLSPLKLSTERSVADTCISQVMLDEEDPRCPGERVSAMMESGNLIKKSVYQDPGAQVDSLQEFSRDTLFEGPDSLDHQILFIDKCSFEDDLFCDSWIQDNDLHLPDVLPDELEGDELYDSLFTEDTSTFEDDGSHTSERIDELASEPLPSLRISVHNDESCLLNGNMSDADSENTPCQNHGIEDKNVKDTKVGDSYDISDIKLEASDQMLIDDEMEGIGLREEILLLD